MSNSKSRVCTSVLGSVTPSNCATLYRSAIPLTITLLLFTVLTPDIRFSTSPTFLSGSVLICCDEITELTSALVCCSFSIPLVEALL